MTTAPDVDDDRPTPIEALAHRILLVLVHGFPRSPEGPARTVLLTVFWPEEGTAHDAPDIKVRTSLGGEVAMRLQAEVASRLELDRVPALAARREGYDPADAYDFARLLNLCSASELVLRATPLGLSAASWLRAYREDRWIDVALDLRRHVLGPPRR